MANNGWATVSYGSVEFDFRATDSVQQEFVFNENNTYEFTRWTFDFNAILNPQSTSFTTQGDGIPKGEAGHSATVTHAAIRDYLAAPRRQFVYAFGKDVLLQCPASGFTVDAQNGPIVEVCDVVESRGVKTFVVHMRVVCCVRECATDVPLLSHVWKSSLDYDEDFNCCRILEGTAVFRSDTLISQGNFPDKFRQNFLHPIPPNMQRERIHIIADEDAVTFHYQLVDREKGMNIRQVTGGPTRFEGYFSSGYEQVGGGDLLVRAAETVAGISLTDTVLEVGAAAAATVVTGGVALAGIIAGKATQIGLRIATTIIPKCVAFVQVKAWGNYYSRRLQMLYWCMGVAISKIAGNGLKLDPMRTNQLNVTEALHAKYCEVQITQRWPSFETLGVNIQNGVQGLAGAVGQFFVNGNIQLPLELPGAGLTLALNGMGVEEINTLFNGVVVRITSVPITNPNISNNGRGNFFTSLLAQTLSQPCQLPPEIPTTPGPATYNATTMDKDLYAG